MKVYGIQVGGEYIPVNVYGHDGVKKLSIEKHPKHGKMVVQNRAQLIPGVGWRQEPIRQWKLKDVELITLGETK